MRGACGQIFADFGPGFVCNDVNGENPHSGIVANITNDKQVSSLLASRGGFPYVSDEKSVSNRTHACVFERNRKNAKFRRVDGEWRGGGAGVSSANALPHHATCFRRNM